jgi:hypothetical protein
MFFLKPTYSMALINLTILTIFVISIFLYLRTFPKKKINLFVLLLIISLLPILSILRPGTYESGDFNIHIFRIIAFFDVLKEGIFIPSWAASLNSSYGNPLFVFNYSFPYYIISIFHFLGIDFINSAKLYLALIMYFSSIAMYFSTKVITKNKLAAFTSSVFYLFCPYHLINIHFRATLGESTIFLFAPLIFLLITKYLDTKKLYWLSFNSIVVAILVISHPLLAICFLALALLYILFTGVIHRRIKYIFLATFSLLLGGIISSFSWISFILYAPFMFDYSALTTISTNSFYNFSFLFYSPWRFGFLFQGPKGELAQIIGYTQLLVVGVLIIYGFKNKIPFSIRKFVYFWLIILFLTILLMNPFSIIFWKHLELFWMLLPYGRLSLIIAFCTSILAGYFAILFSQTPFKKNILYFVIFITISYTILNWGHRTMIPHPSESALRENVGKSTVYEGPLSGFLNNKWADFNNFWFTSPPKNHLEIVAGKAQIKEIGRTSIKHEYTVYAKTPLTIRENTLYFPGWNLTSNNRHIDIYPGYRGIIYAKLPQGVLNVKLEYEDIPVYKFSKFLGITLLFLIILTIPLEIFLQKRKIKKT